MHGGTNERDLARLATTLVGAVAAMSAAGGAIANVTIADYTAGDNYEFQVSYMPDLDQRRLGLPGNGCMFCVPTATMNLFAYAAEWGFESLEPGPGVWQGDVGYWAMTDHLDDLGQLMSTGLDGFDCDDGTDVGGWILGAGDWLDGVPLNRQAHYKSPNDCPSLGTAAYWAANGAIVNICYGRYSFNDAPEPILGARNGGHCVTVQYTRADGTNDRVLYLRDPGGGGDISTQSPWSVRIAPTTNMSVRQDWDNDALYRSQRVDVMEFDSEAATMRVIDKIYLLLPMIGYTFSTVELNIHPLPTGDWSLPPSPQNFFPEPGFTISDVAHGFREPVFYVLMSDGVLGLIQRADHLTGEMAQLQAIPGATDLVLGRKSELFVLAGAQLHRLSLDGQVTATYAIPHACQAIAYRDATDEIYLFSATNERLLVFDTNFELITYNEFLPLPSMSDPSIAVRENDGALAVVIDEMPNTIHGISLEGGVAPQIDQAVIPGLDATSVAFADGDRLVVSTSTGDVREYLSPLPDGWDWELVTPSWYDAMQSAGTFRVSRSRTNFDPVINANDDDVTPVDELEPFGTIVYDCPGDSDNDQLVGVTDLLALLAGWGPCVECPLDLDHDGTIGVADLLQLLSLWGECVL